MKIDPKDRRFEKYRGIPAAEQRAAFDKLKTEAGELLSRSDSGSLSTEDAARFDDLDADLSFLKHVIEQRANLASLYDRGAYESDTHNPYNPTEASTRDAAPDALKGNVIVRHDQSVAAWQRSNGYVREDHGDVRFGRWLRALIVGDWTGAEKERALTEAGSASGGILVPLPLWGSVIDLARNASVVLAAGAQTVPMTAQTLRIPRLTGDPGPAWRNESQAYVQNDLTFDSVELKARSLGRLIRVSEELVADSDPNAISVVEQAFAASIASEIDRVMLRGSGTAPEPRGLLNTAGVPITSHGANGTALTNWDWFLQSAGTVRSNNFQPNAHIASPRALTAASLFKDTQGNYLQAPAALLPVYGTNQVPSNLTVGTSTDTAEIYTGDWANMVLGIRQDLTIRVLTERYADTGEIAVQASFRGDVAVLQPKAFAIDLGIR